MPKRSDRKVFPGSFGANPFTNLTPEEIYKEIQWGNNPKKVISVEAPEPLVFLGYLAKIKFTKGLVSFAKDDYNLAIGSNSNILYIFPVGETNIPEVDETWTAGNLVKETHYYSDKGGDDCYYYHKHEKPFPILLSHPDSVHIIAPQDFNGQRSYAVIKEGIVG